MTNRSQHTPDDALDLFMTLADIAKSARRAGWEVNLAIETGGEAERLTFSAAITKAETLGGA